MDMRRITAVESVTLDGVIQAPVARTRTLGAVRARRVGAAVQR